MPGQLMLKDASIYRGKLCVRVTEQQPIAETSIMCDRQKFHNLKPFKMFKNVRLKPAAMSGGLELCNGGYLSPEPFKSLPGRWLWSSTTALPLDDLMLA